MHFYNEESHDSFLGFGGMYELIQSLKGFASCWLVEDQSVPGFPQPASQTDLRPFHTCVTGSSMSSYMAYDDVNSAVVIH